MTKEVRKRQQRVKSDVDRSQIFIINRPGISEQKSCPNCTQSSGMITVDEAAALRGISTRVIYRLLDEGAIHFIETSQGQLFICLNTFVANVKT